MSAPILLLSLLLVQATCSEAKLSPQALHIFLKQVGISFDKFLQQAKRLLPQLSDSNGVITTTVAGRTYHLPEASCMPRPQAVKVPKVTGTSTFPDYVILDRCDGGCPYAQQIARCLVTHQEKIEVMVTKVNAFSMIKRETVAMYNHTRCDCGCIKKPSDCDYTKHRWDSSTCKCRCIAHGSHCNPRKQAWNEQDCACECIHAPVDCGRTKEWDVINCGCRLPPKLS
ncbi:uncharacterized protein [Acropora muricata]|uniref:uncharacterized protein n=1 Tax=Acropora muricata TaxID=159855 RepID=UPI0034E521F6